MDNFRQWYVSLTLPLLLALCICGCSGPATVSAVNGRLHQDIQVSGELASAHNQSLTPPALRRVWQYQITQLAPEGEQVEAGQVVARLDTAEITRRLQAKTAQLAAIKQEMKTSALRNDRQLAQLKLDLAQAKMEYNKAELKFRLTDNTVARIEQLKYEKDLQLAQAKVQLMEQKQQLEQESNRQKMKMLAQDQHKTSSEEAELQATLAAMTLKAPSAGTLVYGLDYDGNKIQQGQSVYVGDTVVSIADLSQMQVNMAIAEMDARRVKLGQQVQIRLDANPQRRFSGKIIHLGQVFRAKNPALPQVVFDAVASIEHPDPALMRPGMTAKLTIELPAVDTMLLLPKSVVHYDAEQAYVNVPGRFVSHKQNITVGNSDSQYIQVLSGLLPGQSVVGQ
ncbi:RND transporter [Shewanella sp. NFH-SH190041]|uniref:efflux RND transporter periplasmic adaptor subunit n=1 Tax=Shewanella sp. NFH-SH190041 TaxID=2950245 RepID=UPI0021C412F5|nr:efflux RND transporter periplasmic adaptor subunit [Shewanella sp. NFH-SH190041]BDM64748.1 RND transporter [Shewanella sp. NFH-SH190041]